MRSTWVALGLIGACAICCAPLIIVFGTSVAAGVALWSGLSIVQTVAVVLVVFGLAAVGVIALRKRKTASCDCEVQCEIETCEKP